MGAFKLVVWEPLVYTVLTSTGQVALNYLRTFMVPTGWILDQQVKILVRPITFLKHLQKNGQSFGLISS